MSCKGKFIYIQLENEWSSWNTLGMTGSWSSSQQKHSRAQVHLVDDATFVARIRSKNDRVITENLMDQAIVSGVGNYLKSECLYFAGISPHRVCSSISDQDLRHLNNTIKSVIRQSYKTGGATIYTFQNFEGEKGQYTSRFAVYNQENDPQGREVQSFTSPEGRTTFWVPEAQT